ncbi:MAG TPA: tryptophan synthase subunit alpha, partial [Oligoflexia bacterium]|nr:tryptophan synthase subunit alpha [Oligoflexia bacterium]
MITLEDQLKNICSRSTHYRGSKPWPALMTHVVVGYPSLPKTIEIAMTMADAGASLIELQIPFSDPMADGPTIMRANEH